jgi:hypothetical protein
MRDNDYLEFVLSMEELLSEVTWGLDMVIRYEQSEFTKYNFYLSIYNNISRAISLMNFVDYNEVNNHEIEFMKYELMSVQSDIENMGYEGMDNTSLKTVESIHDLFWDEYENLDGRET